MGWNDHVDWELLELVDFVIEEGILNADDPDNLEHQAIGAAMRAVAGYVDGKVVSATPEQRALFDANIGWIGEQAEETQRTYALAYLLRKDD